MEVPINDWYSVMMKFNSGSETGIMRDRIKILPDSVANQIAAGEVVNRPSSAVKELIENAIDAGSKEVTTVFRDGGKMLIQVIDDGIGMSPIDARLAFDRHATSKIDTVEDIYKLHTFGFRGEALASIAAVSELEVRTRRESDELGTKLEINGSKFVSQSSVNCPVGTQFIVKNLFYNIPARRRFLDKSTTESRHIIAEYQRIALCHPDVAFALYDTDSLISKLPVSTLRQRVVNVIGKNIAKNLLDVSANTSIVNIEGFTGRPMGAKQSNKEQFLFVNGRYFRSPYLHKAVVAAYEKLIPANTQPSYFIYLTIDPERIDVNVHPQKTEVKFSDGAEMWQIINAAVRESLAKSGAVPPMDFEMDTSVEIPVFRDKVQYKAPEIRGNAEFNPFDDNASGRTSRADLTDFMEGYNANSEQSDYDSSVMEFIAGDKSEQGELEIDITARRGDILSISKGYFATTIEGALVIVDVCRAHESILYDCFIMMLRNESSVSQQLLFPESITMSMDDISLLRESIGDFVAFGFDISFKDEHTVEITGLPADMSYSSSEQLIYQLLDTIREQGAVSGELRRTQLATTMARMGAVSRSRNVSGEELNALLDQLTSCNNPTYTPSGAAIMTAISEEEIKKRLK